MATLENHWIGDFKGCYLYDEILSVCAEKCPTMSLTLQSGCHCDESVGEFLQRASRFVFRDGLQEWWPAGGTVYPQTQRVLHLHVCTESIALLKSVAQGFYDWLQPALPEDLAFYRPDNRVFLGVIAHEQCTYFSLTPNEPKELKERLPDLVLLERPRVKSDDELDVSPVVNHRSSPF